MPDQLHRDLRAVRAQTAAAIASVERVEQKFDDRLDQEKAHRRWRAWVMLLAVLIGFGWWARYEQNACLRGNQTRGQIREAFHVALVGAYEESDPPRSEAEQAALVAEIDRDLASLLPPRECPWWPL